MDKRLSIEIRRDDFDSIRNYLNYNSPDNIKYYLHLNLKSISNIEEFYEGLDELGIKYNAKSIYQFTLSLNKSYRISIINNILFEAYQLNWGSAKSISDTWIYEENMCNKIIEDYLSIKKVLYYIMPLETYKSFENIHWKCEGKYI